MPGREKCLAQLRYETENPEKARALALALEPDNKVVPEWLRVSCRSIGGLVECMVIVEDCGDPRKILSLRNTIDDIILNLRAAEGAARAIGE